MFKKNQPSANPSGRPPGSTNKLSPELRDTLRDFLTKEGFPKMLELFRRDGISIWFQYHFVIDILPYVMAKQNELKLDINKLSSNEVSIILDKIKNDEI